MMALRSTAKVVTAGERGEEEHGRWRVSQLRSFAVAEASAGTTTRTVQLGCSDHAAAAAAKASREPRISEKN